MTSKLQSICEQFLEAQQKKEEALANHQEATALLNKAKTNAQQIEHKLHNSFALTSISSDHAILVEYQAQKWVFALGTSNNICYMPLVEPSETLDRDILLKYNAQQLKTYQQTHSDKPLRLLAQANNLPQILEGFDELPPKGVTDSQRERILQWLESQNA
jgi:hypothetical protein